MSNGQNRFDGAWKSQFRSDSISSKNHNFRFQTEYRNNTNAYKMHWRLVIGIFYAWHTRYIG